MNILRKGILTTFIAILAICLGIFAFSSFRTDNAFADEESFLAGVYVIDGENDYTVNGSGRITGVNNSVLQSAQNAAYSEVQLVIPAKIGSVDVTGFTNGAFNSVGGYNFESKITFVYLPDAPLTADSPSTDTVFRSAATLVCKQERYAALCAQLPNHAGKITYPVDINLDMGYDTDSVVTVKKLAGQSLANAYDQTSGKWRNTGAYLPTQNGYSLTAWYTDAACTSPIDYTDIQTALNNMPSAPLNYYSVYRPKTNYNIPAEIKLEADGSRYTLERALNGYEPGDDLTVAFANGASFIYAEGNYTVNVRLKSEYGTWTEDGQITIRLMKTRLSLGEIVSWTAKTGTSHFSLISGKVYEYAKRDDTVGDKNSIRYSFSELTDDETQRDYIQRTPHFESEAIARYRNTMITLELAPLKLSEIFEITYTNMVIDGNIQSPGANERKDVGEYTASASIKIKDGYDYTFINYDTTASGVILSQDGKQAIVNKKWYIVETGNPLVVATEEPAEEPEYWGISDWTYNSSYVPATPALSHKDTNTAVTFTITSDNGFTATAVNLSEFANYVNESMPAGEYTITFSVPSVTENTIVYNAYKETHNFTVSPAEFKDTWREDITAKFVNTEFRVQTNANGQYVFQIYNQENTNLLVWSDFASASINPRRNGVWADTAYNNYYDDAFVLTYNLSLMNNNRYLTYSELRNAHGAPDTYIVYYQLEAHNYESLTNVMNDEARRGYCFTVTIYDVISAPDASGLVYNRTRQLISDTALYTVQTVAGDDYTNAGSHSVVLTSNDPTHYRWTANSTEAEYTFNYEIARDDNRTVNRLTFTGWEYGSYNHELNIPSWSTYYTENADNFYTFKLVGENTEYSQDQFGNVPVGNYTLVASALGYVEGDETTSHYNWNALIINSEFSVSVTKVSNEWYNFPSVSWEYQSFQKESNFILASAKFSDATNPVRYSISTDEEGLNIIGGLDGFTTNEKGEVTDDQVIELLNSLKVNTYYLISRVAETENYSGLSPNPQPFEVRKARNSWATPISVNTWIEGRYDPAENTLDGKARFGQAHFRIVDANDDTKVYYDDLEGINELGKAPVGRYILTVTIAEDGNFYGISDYVAFSVFEKPGLPWWGTVLIVIGALGVAALVLYILHQKGVLQLLSGKIIIAMRTKATVDATIAAIRANKVAERARISIAEAEERDRLENEKNNNGTTKDE